MLTVASAETLIGVLREMTEEEVLEKSEMLHLAEVEATLEQLRNQPLLKAKGFCLYCGTDIEPDAVNQRFCDVYCRDQFDKHGSQV